jgi:hypothetical protein
VVAFKTQVVLSKLSYQGNMADNQPLTQTDPTRNSSKKPTDH